MRSIASSLLVVVLLLTGCTRSAPVPTPKPEEPSAGSPEWITLPGVARPEQGAFWAPDQPTQYPAQAYGRVRPFVPATGMPAGSTVEIADVQLPAAPAELPVYVSGAYEGAPGYQHPVQFGALACAFNPHYSELSCEDGPPGLTAITDSLSAEQRARELTEPLWMADWRLAFARMESTQEWVVHFRQEVEGRPFYTDRGLSAHIDQMGTLIHLTVRRRPLLGRSLYPVRSAAEALSLLKEGRGFSWSTMTPMGEPKPGTPFVVDSVEIGYIMPHVVANNELVPPYYIFRNEAGEALFIPAVADPWFTWPNLR